MAINIDSVYQKVLALANKEQRGYITPLEFNLLANQAQLDIFEQYFYDLNQFKRTPADTSSLSDMVELIGNKLKVFTSIESVTAAKIYPANYRTGKIFASWNNVQYEATLVSVNEVQNIIHSSFHRNGLKKNPLYIESTKDLWDIEVYNHNGLMNGAVKCEIIRKPNKVEWGYDVIAEKPLYNASRSTDFQLHDSEETELVYKILALAGVTLKRIDIQQAAQGLDISKIQQEKA